MKYPCNMIKDLLPLYYDDACSDQTKEIVEEHLSECDLCKSIMKKISDNTHNDHLQKEREEVMGHYTKSIKRKSLLAVLCVISVSLLICLIVNIATGNTLDWFFIALTSLMVFVSLTAVPLIVEKRKRIWTFGSFTTSLILLLLTCSLYSNGNWFWVAAISVLFGLSVVFLPFVIGQFPLKGFALQNKGLVIMAIDTILLYAVIIACGIYNNPVDYWKNAFLITTVGGLFSWILFAIIRYFRVNSFIKWGLCFIAGGVFFSLNHDITYWIKEGVLHISFVDANLGVWNSAAMINANTYLLIFLLGCVIGSILLVIGRYHKHKHDKLR